MTDLCYNAGSLTLTTFAGANGMPAGRIERVAALAHGFPGMAWQLAKRHWGNQPGSIMQPIAGLVLGAGQLFGTQGYCSKRGGPAL